MAMLSRSTVVCLVAVMATLTLACSKGKSSEAAPAPEVRRASATQVAAGLHSIDGLTQQIAAASTDEGRRLSRGIEPAWQKIEGTVKANDKDSYLAFEDAFAAIETALDGGDRQALQRAAAKVSETVRSYLAKYPG